MNKINEQLKNDEELYEEAQKDLYKAVNSIAKLNPYQQQQLAKELYTVALLNMLLN